MDKQGELVEITHYRADGSTYVYPQVIVIDIKDGMVIFSTNGLDRIYLAGHWVVKSKEDIT